MNDRMTATMENHVIVDYLILLTIVIPVHGAAEAVAKGITSFLSIESMNPFNPI
jgi:hypothetical protein